MLEGDKFFETDTEKTYIWDGTQWILMSNVDWESVNLDWANITDRPTSTVYQIDSAVGD